MSEKIFDKAALLNRMLGDDELVREVIETFLGDIANKINELRQATDSGDLSRVRDLAHAVKGAAVNASTAVLGDLAFQMEKAGESADLNKAMALMPQIEEQFKVLKTVLVQSGLA